MKDDQMVVYFQSKLYISKRSQIFLEHDLFLQKSYSFQKVVYLLEMLCVSKESPLGL